MFWVFAFPVLLACALGLAFRNQGAPDVLVGVLRGGAVPHTDDGLDARARQGRARARRRSCRSRRRVAQRRDSPPRGAWRAGHLRTRPEPAGKPRQPLRRGRRAADARGPSGRIAGRGPARDGAGLALHRLGGARAARHEHHGHGHVERRVLGGQLARAQAAQAPHRHADAATRLPACRRWRRASSSWCWKWACCSGSRCPCSASRSMAHGCCWRRSACLARWRSRGSACSWRAGRRRSRACRA